MEENYQNQNLQKKRRRIYFTKENQRNFSPSFSDNKLTVQLHDLEQRSSALEERNRKLTLRLEAYHMQMQQANSEKLRADKKVKGVLKHVKSTIAAQEIPGMEPKGTVMEQEIRLLRWKLNGIEKYLSGIYPEHASDNEE